MYHFVVCYSRMKIYLSILRLVARQLPLPLLPLIESNSPLGVLFLVHNELVSDGKMNWGRLLYFLRYAEEFKLSENDWNELFEFLSKRHPGYFSLSTSILVILYVWQYL